MAGVAIAGLVIAAIGTAATVDNNRKVRNANRRANRERLRLQRLRLRRERQKEFTEQRRAKAEAEAQIVARGASTSSAASTVPGSIDTQGAANQSFLSQVGVISGNINAFEQQAENLRARGQNIKTAQNIASTGVQEGLFN